MMTSRHGEQAEEQSKGKQNPKEHQEHKPSGDEFCYNTQKRKKSTKTSSKRRAGRGTHGRGGVPGHCHGRCRAWRGYLAGGTPDAPRLLQIWALAATAAKFSVHFPSPKKRKKKRRRRRRRRRRKERDGCRSCRGDRVFTRSTAADKQCWCLLL